MGKIQRKFVVPGDLIIRADIRPPPNTYRMGDAIYSLKVGLSEVEGRNVRVIPLAGRYDPDISSLNLRQTNLERINRISHSVGVWRRPNICSDYQVSRHNKLSLYFTHLNHHSFTPQVLPVHYPLWLMLICQAELSVLLWESLSALPALHLLSILPSVYFQSSSAHLSPEEHK